jgi:hypothetical protein
MTDQAAGAALTHCRIEQHIAIRHGDGPAVALSHYCSAQLVNGSKRRFMNSGLFVVSSSSPGMPFEAPRDYQ